MKNIMIEGQHMIRSEILSIAQRHFDSIDEEQIINFAKELLESESFYKKRVEELQKIQSQMRDPERKMVCDIIANGRPSPLGYKLKHEN